MPEIPGEPIHTKSMINLGDGNGIEISYYGTKKPEAEIDLLVELGKKMVDASAQAQIFLIRLGPFSQL